MTVLQRQNAIKTTRYTFMVSILLFCSGAVQTLDSTCGCSAAEATGTEPTNSGKLSRPTHSVLNGCRFSKIKYEKSSGTRNVLPKLGRLFCLCGICHDIAQLRPNNENKIDSCVHGEGKDLGYKSPPSNFNRWSRACILHPRCVKRARPSRRNCRCRDVDRKTAH